MYTISRKRIFILMVAVFLIGIAVGLLLYPSIGSPTTVFNALMFLSAMLILLTLRWERRF